MPAFPCCVSTALPITTHFYREMFAARPELTWLFNMGNQANGAQQQSLASAVFAYAANVDRADVLAPCWSASSTSTWPWA